MNKNQFLVELRKRLRGIPQEEFEQAVEYYEEYFLDAEVDDVQDVTSKVGTPDEVARRIWDECVDKRVQTQREEGGVKNTAKTVWLIILGIFAAPIALPIAIAIAAVIFALVVSVIAVIASIVIAAVSIVVFGIVSIPAIFIAHGLGQALVVAGMSLLAIALGTLLCLGIFQFGAWVVTKVAGLLKRSIDRKGGR